MEATTESNDVIWQQLAPELDEAMAQLRDKDRDAIVLRFFENKSLREVGTAMGLEERAAQKRVTRGLEKLRAFFTKRGFTLSATVIAAALAANSVQAAPAGISVAATAAAATKGITISATIAALVKGTMKTMMWLKLKFAAGIGVVALVAGSAATVAISQTSHTGSSALTVPEIIQQSRNVYAALTSYSDEGTSLGNVGTNVVAPHIFTIKLSRPNLYRIDWSQSNEFYVSTGMVWSAGSGDFMIMKGMENTQTNRDMAMALSSATGVSGGAAGSIPGTFFNSNWGNRLGPVALSATRAPDEAVGGIDCYVLTRATTGRNETLWIGKQDFLIRQIETKTSAATLDAAMQAQANRFPQMHLPTVSKGDVRSLEIHTNIVVNQPLSPADFAP
jgi:outer membrane lipoprotein-sorting protein